MDRARVTFFLAIAALFHCAQTVQGKRAKEQAAAAAPPGLQPDGTYDWDAIMAAGRDGSLDINTNGDVLPSAKAVAAKGGAKKPAVKAPTPEEVQLQWEGVMEAAKTEAAKAAAPAPLGSMVSSMAPHMAPSGQTAPEDQPAMAHIKLADGETAAMESAPGYKMREGYKPLSWLQKTKTEG